LESNFKQKEYINQRPDEGNPPSMIFPLQYLVELMFKNETSFEMKTKIIHFLGKN
jgi:hypothetical protein